MFLAFGNERKREKNLKKKNVFIVFIVTAATRPSKKKRSSHFHKIDLVSSIANAHQ